MNQSAWTTTKLLDWATKDFVERGFPDSRLSAEVLLAHAMNTNRVGLYMRFDELASEEVRKKFREYVELRRTGKPVAYIVGTKEFYSMEFIVDSRVLIPRPETELLVDEALAFAKTKGAGIYICDVGCGSGAIPIVLKKKLSESKVLAIDFSKDALEISKQNALKHGVEIQWIQSDLLENLSETVDVMTANLPYVPTQDIETLLPDVRNFEPTMALEGGPDGISLISKLIPQAMEKLNTGGCLFLEIGIGQSESVKAKMSQAGFQNIKIRKDLAGIPRIVYGVK